MRANLAFRWRISFSQEYGKVQIGMLKPAVLLSIFTDGEALRSVAGEVEQQTIEMTEAAN